MITLVINGRQRALDCMPDTPLLWAIRDAAELPGTHPGCLIGMCGACTVHVDGQPVRACITPVQDVAGKAVTTIEGLAATPLGRALARAWAEHAVSPCGHCGSGQMMVAAALLRSNPHPDDDEIAATVGENVCSCDNRGNLAPAVRQAARAIGFPNRDG